MKKSLCELVEREGRREILAKNNPNGRCSEGSACQCLVGVQLWGEVTLCLARNYITKTDAWLIITVTRKSAETSKE